jgi:hypothetical protein
MSSTGFLERQYGSDVGPEGAGSDPAGDLIQALGSDIGQEEASGGAMFDLSDVAKEINLQTLGSYLDDNSKEREPDRFLQELEHSSIAVPSETLTQPPRGGRVESESAELIRRAIRFWLCQKQGSVQAISQCLCSPQIASEVGDDDLVIRDTAFGIRY